MLHRHEGFSFGFKNAKIEKLQLRLVLIMNKKEMPVIKIKKSNWATSNQKLTNSRNEMIFTKEATEFHLQNEVEKE